MSESLYAKKVLELFKKNKNKFGVVVDEYGNTEGIITLHDLTESIFCDILEENETEEEEIVTRADGSMLVEASMNIDDFMEAMGILNYDDLKEEFIPNPLSVPVPRQVRWAVWRVRRVKRLYFAKLPDLIRYL